MLIAALLALLGCQAAQEPAPPTQEERQENAELLLRKLANPLAALASLAMIGDFDYHVGPEEKGHRSTIGVSPTLPLHLGDQWNLISKSNLPIIYQEEIAPGTGAQTGLGDITEVLYLAAVEPSRRGWIWAGGPVVRIPTGSDDLLTLGKWAVGPSLGAVKQFDGFTIGLIASQLWSVAGSSSRADLEIGTLDAFFTYEAEGLWNLSLRAPCSYDFYARHWTIPIALTVEKLVSFQKYPVTITFGIRYWADSRDAGPHDLGFRFGLTIVFPN